MYDRQIDKKWQKKWEENKIAKFDKKKVDKKYYCLEMFSYPSGAKLHVGHWYNYGPVDTFARFKKMQGYELFQPMGFDAFGLPAENYAIKTGIHPYDSTMKNIETMEEQLKAMGAMFNWDAEVITCKEDYYKWTQWLFLKLYEMGLAYRKKANVNWCPSCNTVLANEQVLDGLCERCSSVVTKKDLTQWFFKITDYAEELLSGLEGLDWPEKTKKIQKNWIGKSTGSIATFQVDGKDLSFDVFTTRVDTICGVSYVVIAPEHELVPMITTEEQREEVEAYQEKCKLITEIDRLTENREKTGVFTGSYAINPVTGEKVQIWIADYVLASYGTGCVMAVPAHDERDFEFATKYQLPIKQVIAPVIYGKGKDTIREDKEFTPMRMTIDAIVKHPQKEEYLVLDWKQDWTSFVIGGVEEGETLFDAVKREVKEETGFVDIKSMELLDAVHVNRAYISHKDINRYALHHPVIVELASLEQVPTLEKETKNHIWKWIKKEELIDYLNLDNQKLMAEFLVNGKKALTEAGELIHSGKFDGLQTEEAKVKITEYLKEKHLGDFKTTYRLRDWLVSRQRYWGAPIPIIYCDTCGVVPVPEEQLPVKLPYDVEFKPDGKSPLAKSQKFVHTTCPHCGKEARRETDTLDTFVCSSWYQFRYPDNKNTEKIFDTQWIDQMLPVDKYVGGPEHAAMHLLYARFITKVLRDAGYTKVSEPFKSLVHQGLILGPDGNKMSKSKGNVISPDDYVNKYGSDVFRMYLMFGFSYFEGGPWSEDGVVAMSKFVGRLERILQKVSSLKQNTVTQVSQAERELLYVFHHLVKGICYDLEHMQFNTAIAKIMEITNALYKYDNAVLDENKNITLIKEMTQQFIQIIAPFAPHFAEEMWNQFGNESSIFLTTYPSYDEKWMQKQVIELPVQVNGNMKFKIEVDKDLSKEQIEQQVLQEERLALYLNGKQVRKVIVVPGKIVNIVVG